MNLKPRPCKVRKNGAPDLSFFWRTCNACRRTRRNVSVGNLGVRRAEEISPASENVAGRTHCWGGAPAAHSRTTVRETAAACSLTTTSRGTGGGRGGGSGREQHGDRLWPRGVL